MMSSTLALGVCSVLSTYLLYFYFFSTSYTTRDLEEERDVCLLHVGMPGQEGCYTEIVSL